jgi:hypothetical protein
MDHDIVLFAELYSSVYNNIVAVVSITCQIKSGLPGNQVESSEKSGMHLMLRRGY